MGVCRNRTVMFGRSGQGRMPSHIPATSGAVRVAVGDFMGDELFTTPIFPKHYNALGN